MTSDVIAPPAPVRLAVEGGGTFPVREVYCIGRNYADHAREMGHDPDREPPFFFRKDREHLVPGGGHVPYPPATEDLHYEVELVVALGAGGSNLSLEQAEAAIWGYAVGIDLTRRDLQGQAKEMRRPWDMGKGFAGSGPVGTLVAVDAAGVTDATPIRLTCDGAEVQVGTIGQMIWPVAEAIAYLSTLVALHSGDLIFTGTPAGVGPVMRGQTLVAEVGGLPSLTVTMT